MINKSYRENPYLGQPPSPARLCIRGRAVATRFLPAWPKHYSAKELKQAAPSLLQAAG